VTAGAARRPGLPELADRLSQNTQLTLEIAATLADSEVHAQRDPLAEAELSILALGDQLADLLA
jgi:hypothetical protein